MCGICGYLGQGDAGLLEEMNRRMRHRGPDDAGLWVSPEGGAGLGMVRLAIIDLAGGRQPMHDPAGRVSCVFNGEIYNYRELRRELEAAGHAFATGSDTEVLVHGYLEWGEALPGRLRGMFAFALYDRQAGRLFCARDRLGIKPFYYRRSGADFYFASEQKCLLATPGCAAGLEPRALARHLVAGFLAGPWSVFAGMSQLPPGHFLVAGRDGVRLARYWSLPARGGNPEPDPAAAADLVREALADAVRSHLVSDVPLGLALSGGMDSSAVAHFMCRELPASDLAAFTVGYGQPSDEFPYAEAAGRSCGLRLAARTEDLAGLLEELPRIVWHLEEPLANVVSFTTWAWARQVAGSRKVCLIGEGSDELFGGYPQHRIFASPAGFLAPGLAARLYRLAFLQPRLALAKALLPDTAALVDEVFHEEFLPAMAREGRGLDAALRFDQAHELPNYQLLRVDRLTMAFGLEARVPFLDHPLVELAASLPDRLKVGRHGQKLVLKAALRQVLPAAILARPKRGPGGSQALFPILAGAGLESAARRLLAGRLGRELFAPAAVAGVLEGRVGRLPALGPGMRAKLLFSMLLWVVWGRLYLEGEGGRGESLPALSALAA